MLRSVVTTAVVLALASASLVGCKKKQDQAMAPETKIHVETVDVAVQPMPKGLALSGTLKGQRQADLAADASGRIIETMVERGSRVKKGDVLVKVDIRAAAAAASEAAANVALARVQGESAKRDCERYKDLLAKNAITQAEFDRTADACKTQPLTLRAAQARASAASLNVTDGTIRAPFAGVIAERFAEVGQFVHTDTKVVSLVDDDPLRVELTVPEANLAAVKEGAKLTFTVVAFQKERFEGTVKFVSGAVRSTTRDVVAEAEVPNGDHKLLPGMFADVTLETGEEKLPVVPKPSIFLREEHEVVFVVVDGHLEERAIQVGVAKGDVVSVLRGLKGGEKIVKKPDATLLNGQAVE